MDFPQHSKQVLEQLNQQRQLGLLCDCTFVVDGIDFKAHKAVLAACSEYFRMLFVDQKDVVHLDISNAAGMQVRLLGEAKAALGRGAVALRWWVVSSAGVNQCVPVEVSGAAPSHTSCDSDPKCAEPPRKH